MAEELKLRAEKRPEGKKASKIRREDKIPAILYGRRVKNVPLQVDYKDFADVYERGGGTSLVSLCLGKGEERKVLIHEVQKDPLSGKFIHADFYQVKMTEKLVAEVPLRFTGKSKAVKDKGGILVKNISEVEVEALPQDLPKEIKVDISPLKEIDDVIKIKDLKVSPKVAILADKDEVVAVVTPPRTEEELKELEEKPEEAVEEVEGIKEEKAKEGKEVKGAEEAKEGEEVKEGEEKKEAEAAKEGKSEEEKEGK